VRGLQQVMVVVRGDIVDEMILGDLAGSRVFLAHDARPLRGGRWSTIARWFGGDRVGGAITRAGKAMPMLFEESDGA
jgi:hypothetical protein